MKNFDRYPTSPLYHYTSVNALEQILSTRRLRLTNFADLSDAYEGRYGARQLLEGVIADPFFRPCKDSLRQLRGSEPEEVRWPEDTHAYVLSICKNPDDRRMWREYAPSGVCVAFQFDEAACQMVEGIHSGDSLARPDVSMLTTECIYTQTRMKRFIKFEIGMLKRQIGTEPLDSPHAWTLLTKSLLSAALRFKKLKYRYESEWRIAFTPLDSGVIPETLYSEPDRRPKRYVYMRLRDEMQPLPILSVRLSPNITGSDRERVVQMVDGCWIKNSCVIQPLKLPVLDL